MSAVANKLEASLLVVQTAQRIERERIARATENAAVSVRDVMRRRSALRYAESASLDIELRTALASYYLANEEAIGRALPMPAGDEDDD